MKRLRGFTLAEVLITLGVIGVVASMTMPTLIQNYKKAVTINQLKKTYSTFAQALNKLMADDEVTTLSQTDLAKIAENHKQCKSQADNAEATTLCNSEKNVAVYNILKKYLNVVSIQKLDGYSFAWLNMNDSGENLNDSFGMFLSDGTILIKVSDAEFLNDGTLYYSFYFDINGLKGPNIVGRDIFKFDIYSDKLYPCGTKAYSEQRFKYSKDNKDLRNWENGTQIYNCTTKNNSYGNGCAGRIFDEGTINY